MKLHSKIFLSFLIGVVLLLSAITITIYNFQKKELISALEDKIRISEQSINRVVIGQKKSLITSVQTVAKDWGLRQAIGRKNRNTIISALDNHRLRVNASNAYFVSNQGKIFSSNTDISDEINVLTEQLFTSHKVKKFQTFKIAETYYQAVFSEVKAPQKLGWLLMVFSLKELKDAVIQVSKRNDVKVVVFKDSNNKNLMLSSHELVPKETDFFHSLPISKSLSVSNEYPFNGSNIILRISNYEKDSSIYIGVFASVEEALKPLREFWQYMQVLFIIFACISLLLTYLAAKGITRPLQILLSNVKKLEAGDFSTEINIKRKDEIGDLALAFKSMQLAISEREKTIVNSINDLQHQAMHDSLTGLPNRRKLAEELEQANTSLKISGEKYYVCILDLDQFKVVNDTSGHAAGDALLVRIASILLKTVRKRDSVVRLGGDEFALILLGGEDQEVLAICNEIRLQIKDLVFVWEKTSHRIGVSIGLFPVLRPYDNLSNVLKQADAGCFIAKENGRNQVYLVSDTSETLEKKHDELHWVQRINKAIDNDEFILFSQPIIALKKTERTELFEVLVRLRHYETGKLVSPGAFIPSAERYGLSVKIDRWVITHLMKILPVYQEIFSDKRIFWVNLSGSSLADGEFIYFLEQIIQKSKLPHGNINFEITETTVIQNIDEVSAVMQRLKKLGCSFALADFGSGVSSFDCLKRLPVDYLKIDAFFVRNICIDNIDRMFVKSIIDIAHAMNIKIVTGSVENENILNEIIALGSDFGLGRELGEPSELIPPMDSTPKNYIAS